MLFFLKRPLHKLTEKVNCLFITVVILFTVITSFHNDCYSEENNSSLNKKILFPASNNEIIFQKNGNFTIFANNYNGLEFITIGKKLFLSRLYGFDRSQDFISLKKKLQSSLWRLALRKNSGRDNTEIFLSGIDDAVTTVSINKSKEEEATLVLNWKGLDIESEKDIIDVEVKITLKSNDPESFWRINVNNRSNNYGVWCVYFPVFKLVPIGAYNEDNYLVVGRSRGILVKNPFNYNPRQAFGFVSKDGVTWPGGLNMQFQALYNTENSGLYIATNDGEGYKKSFYFAPEPKNEVMEYKIGHYPSNMGFPGEDYHMNYDVVVRPFNGDWYDAAQIYKSWASRQSWCQNGVLKDRKDIPSWFKETPIMLKVTSNKGAEDLPRLKDRVIGFLRFIGTDLPINWYVWKQYIPEMSAFNRIKAKINILKKSSDKPVTNTHDGAYPEIPALSGFGAVCNEISKARGHVLPYVCSRIFDPGIDENAPLAKEAKPNTMKDVDGNIITQNHGLTWTMCYHTKWWQTRLKETILGLMNKEHARGIYFDTFYGGYVQCFDIKHGHSYGGGNDSYLGAKKLASIVRETMKKADQESVMTGENSAETAIDLLDGILYRWNAWPDMIPLFATVYGNFIPRYGMELDPNSDGFYCQCALLFIEGAIMGRLSLHGDDLLKDFENGSIYTEKMDFLRKLAKYWSPKIGGNYLAYGKLLRPLNIIKMNPDFNISYNEPEQRYENGTITIKALQSGVFEADDESIGIFIVNVSDTPISFSFDLAPDKYPLNNNNKVVRIDEMGKIYSQGESKTNRIIIEDKISGHDVLFFCIRPKG